MLSVRLPDEMVARIEAIAKKLSDRAKGARITRSEALRMCVERGLGELERELDSNPPPARKR